MGWIKRMLYGVLIGIAAIAPGLSGGTIAIALGFYEDLLRAVGNLLTDFKKNALYLLPFGAGGMASVAALSVVISFLFSRYPLPSNMLFIGFILGTLPFITGKLRSNLKGLVSHIFTALLFFILVLIPLFLKPAGISEISSSEALSGGPKTMLLLVLLGVIIAAALVIPGLSGTMILSAMGFYKTLLLIASTFVTALAGLDFSAAFRQMIFILPLVIGVLLGIFLTARFISLLFEKVPAYVYSAVLGLILATPFVMLADIRKSDFSVFTISAGAAALAAGLLLVRKLGDMD
ncbi:DUF368 domain-containing protein [bacterium 210820-DFI.6.37]|nr:DUF368 domain-containing protein [bacterium 210820-DFI.6.37]